MAVPLTGIIGSITNLIPSSQDILQQVILGAGASVVLSGLKTNAGMDAIDPLHVFHKDTVTPTNNPNNIVGPTATASALNAMTPAAQQVFWANGGHLVNG